PIISAQTWSPACQADEPSPVFTTVPEHSRPGISGAPGGIGWRPMRCKQSARLTPAAAIRINTSPGFGSGTGRVAGISTSGPPGHFISTTVWVAGILASIEVLSLAERLRYYSRADTVVSCSASPMRQDGHADPRR